MIRLNSFMHRLSRFALVVSVFTLSAGGYITGRLHIAKAGTGDVSALHCEKIYRCPPEQLDGFLRTLNKKYSFENRLEVIADRFIGAPYCCDPLKNEKTHWLPYTKTNCTLFVLTACAFANSSSYEEALRHMRMLHYRDGVVGFENRYHFTADRITSAANPYFSPVTKKYIRDPRRLQKTTLELNRMPTGNHFFRGRLGGWTKTVTIAYVPSKGFDPDSMLPLPEALGIAFVKSSNWEKGIIMGHEGILIHGDLYHASPATGVHIEKDYLKTCFAGSSWDGFVLFSFGQVP